MEPKISVKIKKEVYQRICNGESVSILTREYTISRKTLYKWKKEGISSKRKVNEGLRKQFKLTESQKHKVVALKRNNPQIRYAEIKRLLNLEVTDYCLYRYLNKAGLTNKRKNLQITLENYQDFLTYDLRQLKRIVNANLKNSENVQEYAEKLLAITKLYFEKGLINEVIEFCNKIKRGKKEYYQYLGNKDSLLHYYQGQIYSSLSNSELSKFHFEKASELFEEIDASEDSVANVRSLLSLMPSLNENQAYNIAAVLGRVHNSTKNQRLKTYISNALGYYHFKIRNWYKAEQCYQDFLNSNVREDREIASTYYNLGLCLKNQEKYREALKAFSRAEDLNQNDLKSYAKILKEKAIIRIRRKAEDDIAEHLLLNAKSIFKKISENREYIVTIFQLCRYYHLNRNFKAYGVYQTELQELAKEERFRDLVEKVFELLEKFKRENVVGR